MRICMTLDWTDGRLDCIYVSLFSLRESPSKGKTGAGYKARKARNRMGFIGSSALFALTVASPYDVYVYVYVTFWGSALWGSTQTVYSFGLLFRVRYSCWGSALWGSTLSAYRFRVWTRTYSL